MEEKKKGNNTVVILLLGIIIVLLVCLILLLATRFKNEDTPSNNKKDNEVTEKEKPLEEVSIDNNLVEEAYSLIPMELCGQANFKLDKKDKKITALSNKEKMEMIENHYRMDILKYTNEGDKLYVTEDELKRYFEDTSFVADYVNNTSESERRIGLADEMLYSDGTLSMKHLYGTGCVGPSQGTYVKKYSAKKNEEKLVLNTIQYTVKAENDELGSDGNYHFIYKVYKDEDMTEQKYEGYLEGEANEVLDGKDFSGYQFIFNIKDDHLRLEEIKYLENLSDAD